MSKLDDFVATAKAKVQSDWDSYVGQCNVDLFFGQSAFQNPEGTIFRARASFGDEHRENYSGNFVGNWRSTRLYYAIKDGRKSQAIRVSEQRAYRIAQSAFDDDPAILRLWEISSPLAWLRESGIEYMMVDTSEMSSWDLYIRLSPPDALFAKLRWGMVPPCISNP